MIVKIAKYSIQISDFGGGKLIDFIKFTEFPESHEMVLKEVKKFSPFGRELTRQMPGSVFSFQGWSFRPLRPVTMGRL